MDVLEVLDQVKKKASVDEMFRQALMATKQSDSPLRSFCEICQNAGFSIYPMDIVAAGEETYAAMRRSTNGGGENSPLLKGEDDLYEMFIIGLE